MAMSLGFQPELLTVSGLILPLQYEEIQGPVFKECPKASPATLGCCARLTVGATALSDGAVLQRSSKAVRRCQPPTQDHTEGRHHHILGQGGHRTQGLENLHHMDRAPTRRVPTPQAPTHRAPTPQALTHRAPITRQ